jgi:hypothetical protein
MTIELEHDTMTGIGQNMTHMVPTHLTDNVQVNRR